MVDIPENPNRQPAEVVPTPAEPSGALEYRLRQQALLAELGRRALTAPSVEELLRESSRLVALGLETSFCKVLEYLPQEGRLLVRAGVGWEDHVIGVATIGAELVSPAGYALHTGKPVISNDLQAETRFRTPELLKRHGIERAINVMSLVDASVSNYQRRGFKNLMVSFGCTGGQHRSVYLAEQVAKRLQERSGLEVVLHHRELEKLEPENVEVAKSESAKSTQ